MKPLRLGVVGHRRLGSAAVEAWVARQCRECLTALADATRAVTAISAIAEGADTLFAEAAVALGIPLEIVVPFDGYAGDFSDPATLHRYESLRFRATREVRLPFGRRSDEAYVAAMERVITDSDYVLAVWDGQPPMGVGGTAHAVERLNQLGRAWIHLDVRARRARFRVGGAASAAAVAEELRRFMEGAR